MTQETIDELYTKNKFVDVIKTQRKQSKAVLLSMLNLIDSPNKKTLTGDVYKHYTGLCKTIPLKNLTQRRVGGLISELSLQGLITTKVISKGRYGRMREIELNVPLAVSDELKRYLNTHFKIQTN